MNEQNDLQDQEATTPSRRQLLVALAVLVINLLTALMYSWVGPRIKYA